MKKIKRLLLTVMLLFTVISPFEIYAEGIGLIVNNKTIRTQLPLINRDGTVYAYYKDICSGMGFEVSDVSSAKMNGRVNFKNDDIIIIMAVNEKRMAIIKRNSSVNTEKEISAAPISVDGNLYIPLREFVVNTGGIIGWDQENGSVIVIYDTDLTYINGKTIEIFSGVENQRSRIDGDLWQAGYVAPESMAIAEDGTLYISDSGVIRIISGSEVSTLNLEPSYISPSKMVCNGSDLYFVSNEFYDTASASECVAVIKYSGGVCKSLTPRPIQAGYSNVKDIDVAADGTVYLLIKNNAVGQEYIAVIGNNSSKMEYLAGVDEEFSSLCVGREGELFLASASEGCIYRFNISTGEMKSFSGVKGKTAFVDGPNARYFEPREMEYSQGALYVLDRNVLRRVTLTAGGDAMVTETVAGKVDAVTAGETVSGKASEAILTPSYAMDIEVTGYGVLISDPKKAVIRIVK